MSFQFTGPINLGQLQAALGNQPACVLTCSGDEWAGTGTKTISCPSLTFTDAYIEQVLTGLTYDPVATLETERANLLQFLSLAQQVASGATPASSVTLTQVVEAVAALGVFLEKYWS